MKVFSINRCLLVIGGVLIFATAGFGQLRSNVHQNFTSPSLKSVASSSWLDPQRFSMSHGFSVSFMSGGLAGGPASLSVYTNQMQYFISENMVLNSQIHLAQPGVLSATQLGGNNLRMYYQTALDWQLSKNVKMHLGISNLPYRGYGSGWGRRMYSPYLGSQRWDESPFMD